ncbi:MAG TPA: T9SS type A sorting domain-containing protein [Flavobacteriales bacterium]|nr:T9SS type A sorting domain-containing protein [Flavobacteriales bacterium]HMR27808.1 T9SS type A sorting domain-containing protein [Flavobacteriales bacterium]
MRAALLTMALLPLLASAQSWCPPGAEWHLSTGGYLFSGYLHRTYTGDTVIVGRTAQRLNDEGYIISTFSGQPEYLAQSAVHYTSVENDLVLILKNNVWDTLVRFDAVPGDRWYPGAPQPCGEDHPAGMYQVVDTTTYWVDGFPLRSCTLDGVQADGSLIGGPLLPYHERIGLLGGLIFDPWCMFDGGYESVRCYSDNEISYHAPDWLDVCDLGLHVDRYHRDLLMPFPNPGSSHFTLDLPQGPHTITLFDATGRMVLQQRTTDLRPVVATEALPAGLYRITVRDGRGGVLGATWVKDQARPSPAP